MPFLVGNNIVAIQIFNLIYTINLDWVTLKLFRSKFLINLSFFLGIYGHLSAYPLENSYTNLNIANSISTLQLNVCENGTNSVLYASEKQTDKPFIIYFENNEEEEESLSIKKHLGTDDNPTFVSFYYLLGTVFRSELKTLHLFKYFFYASSCRYIKFNVLRI